MCTAVVIPHYIIKYKGLQQVYIRITSTWQRVYLEDVGLSLTRSDTKSLPTPNEYNRWRGITLYQPITTHKHSPSRTTNITVTNGYSDRLRSSHSLLPVVSAPLTRYPHRITPALILFIATIIMKRRRRSGSTLLLLRVAAAILHRFCSFFFAIDRHYTLRSISIIHLLRSPSFLLFT